MYTTLISTRELAGHIDDPTWVIVDCRFTLADPLKGRSDYLQAHIPGAVYAHLNEDLSGPVKQGSTGRHPLPSVEAASHCLGRLGIRGGVQVVAYDDTGGAIGAARLWWLLRWLGHDAAAVLDGGWQLWQQEEHPVRGGVEERPAVDFKPAPRPELFVTSEQIEKLSLDSGYRLIDVRAPERFQGLTETIDPVAGRIPGAHNAPYKENLGPDGTFLPKDELRRKYEAWLDGIPPERAVFYCGSGVSAAHSLLALAYTGLGEGRLYPGSWSEWITDPRRPIAKD